MCLRRSKRQFEEEVLDLRPLVEISQMEQSQMELDRHDIEEEGLSGDTREAKSAQLLSAGKEFCLIGHFEQTPVR